MRDILSIVRQFVLRSLDRIFRNPWRRSNDPEKWIEEFKFLSGRGHSYGQRSSRYEAHQR
jgi:hypothetical protein